MSHLIENTLFHMWNLKILFLSFFTSSNKSHQLKEKFDKKAKILALSNGLDISFYCFLVRLPYRDFGSIDLQKIENEQHIPIQINSRYIRAEEEKILITYFHEYCHFLFPYSSPGTDFRKSGRYTGSSIPNDIDRIVEDFCDDFGNYIVHGTTGRDDSDKFIKKFIESTIQKIHKENRMQRIS